MNPNIWSRRIETVFKIILVIFASLFLASLVHMGAFALPTWDDLGWNSGISNATYLESALGWYSNISGRYVFGFIMAAVVRIPGFVEGVPWLVPLGIVLWILSSFAVVRAFLPQTEILRSAALALVFCFFEVLCLPNIRHTFYWIAGLINIALPMVAFKLLIACCTFLLFREGHRSGWRLAVVTAFAIFFTIIAMGSYEPLSIVVLSLLAVLVLHLRNLHGDLGAIPRHKRIPLLIIMVVALIAFIFLLSPGNAHRVDHHLESQVRTPLNLAKAYLLNTAETIDQLSKKFICLVAALALGMCLKNSDVRKEVISSDTLTRDCSKTKPLGLIFFNFFLSVLLFILLKTYIFLVGGAGERIATPLFMLAFYSSFLAGDILRGMEWPHWLTFSPALSLVGGFLLISFCCFHSLMGVTQAVHTSSWHRIFLEHRRKSGDIKQNGVWKIQDVPYHKYLMISGPSGKY